MEKAREKMQQIGQDAFRWISATRRQLFDSIVSIVRQWPKLTVLLFIVVVFVTSDTARQPFDTFLVWARQRTPPKDELLPIYRELKEIFLHLGKFFSQNSYVFTFLLTLLIFRRQLQLLVSELIDIVPERGLSIDVKGFRFEVAEPILETKEGETLSPALFEVKAEPISEGQALLYEFAPQIQFQVHDKGGLGVEALDLGLMRLARNDLQNACARNAEKAELTQSLEKFVVLLEKSRFCEAGQFAVLVDKNSALKDCILTATRPDNDATQRLILHCTGVAYTHKASWEIGKGILSRIVWKDDKLSYLPAADDFVACTYNAYIDRHVASNKIEADTANFFTSIEKILEQGDSFAQIMNNGTLDTLTQFGINEFNFTYCKKELNKTLGLIYSIIGEYSQEEQQRTARFNKAKWYLQLCAQTISYQTSVEVPTALDFNNLADLYRQMRDFTSAHKELEKIDKSLWRPLFDETKAMILWDEGKRQEAIDALRIDQLLNQTSIDSSSIAQDITNRLLAAKMMYAIENVENQNRLASIAKILDQTLAYAEQRVEVLGIPRAQRLIPHIREMLGFSYLQLDGHEAKAVASLEPLLEIQEEPEVTWRRKIRLAGAQIHLSRVQRRERRSVDALHQWDKARRLLTTSNEMLKFFRTTVNRPSPQQLARYFRIVFHTMVVNVELAEEGFYQGELKVAQTISKKTLPGFFEYLEQQLPAPQLRKTLGRDGEVFDHKLPYFQSRSVFLTARMLARSDPPYEDVAFVEKVRQLFSSARGASFNLDRCIDLEVGDFLLNAAVRGTGDSRFWYDIAVAALNNAIHTEDALLRSQVVRTLERAYNCHRLVQRRQRLSLLQKNAEVKK